jgi:hypothetical protein
MCFGATANNITNDPASHSAVQKNACLENSPDEYQVLPEVIWAAASGGGTWVTEVQIIDFSGGSVVSAYFTPYGGLRRGPFFLWTGPGIKHSVKFTNILETLDGLDPEYNYFGRVGALEFVTQDGSHFINSSARTTNGNYSKTFQANNYMDAHVVDTNKQMMIQNLTSNDAYRSAVGCFNVTDKSLAVQFGLIDANGDLLGSSFFITIEGNQFMSFNPFTRAGVAYPAYKYDNVWIIIYPTEGLGQIMCFGATTNNNSNDPAAHVGVQYR